MRHLISALDEAKYNVVHEYPGGAVELAPLVRMKSGTLSNKVNSDLDTHHLMVDESVSIQHVANDYRILHAEAMMLNHVCIKLGTYEGLSDVELLTAYANYHAELGETAAAISKTMGAKRITRAAFNRIKEEGFEDMQMFFEFIARLEVMIDE